MTSILTSIHGDRLGLDASGNLLVHERVYVDAGGTPKPLVAGMAGVLDIVKVTQAAYDALSPPVATTLYVIVG